MKNRDQNRLQTAMRIATLSATIAFPACSATPEGTVESPSPTGALAAEPPVPSACSSDGSDAFVVGTYIKRWDDPALDPLVNQLLPNCAFCYDIYGATVFALDSGGETWSTAWSPDHSKIFITYKFPDGSTSTPNGWFTADGHAFYDFEVTYTKQPSQGYTCDGQVP
jgi:hypothetical protein